MKTSLTNLPQCLTSPAKSCNKSTRMCVERDLEWWCRRTESKDFLKPQWIFHLPEQPQKVANEKLERNSRELPPRPLNCLCRRKKSRKLTIVSCYWFITRIARPRTCLVRKSVCSSSSNSDFRLIVRSRFCFLNFSDKVYSQVHSTCTPSFDCFQIHVTKIFSPSAEYPEKNTVYRIDWLRGGKKIGATEPSKKLKEIFWLFLHLHTLCESCLCLLPLTHPHVLRAGKLSMRANFSVCRNLRQVIHIRIIEFYDTISWSFR